jgi:3,4-dihydroxy 2-butanone 4-phosphate synthase/GTP cyclohydrolase II
MRSGHTEAAIDLCKLAGVPPVGVICELANDDGTVKKGPQIEGFAKEHGLKRISVADLIAYRQAREKLVERIGTFPVETPWGSFTGYAYATPFDSVHHFALVHGRIGDGRNLPVRLHRANVVADVFAGGGSIAAALKRLAREGRGVLVYLRDGTAGVPTTSFHDEPPRARRRCARANGARSASGPRSCGISACSPSGTWRAPPAPMWAFRASASSSWARSRSRADASPVAAG